jgi:arsenate reductase
MNVPDDQQLDAAVETGTGTLRLDLTRRLVAEGLGTGFLIIAVIGSGIMASRLSPDDIGLQLLENAAATAGALIALILMFGGVSGAHFNPVVTLVDRLFGTISSRGCRRVHGRSDRRWLPSARSSPTSCSTCPRSNGRRPPDHPGTSGSPRSSPRSDCCSSSTAASAPDAQCRPVRGRCLDRRAYWFTSSTSFANPAVTIARTLSDTFAGIKPSSAPMFIVMQLVGAALAFVLIRFLYQTTGDRS